MKKSKIIIVLFTLVWILVAITIESSLRNFPFSVIVRSDQNETELFCNVLDGNYYIFLPSYTDSAEIAICADDIFGVTINGVRLSDEMNVRQFPLDTPLELTYRSFKGIQNYQITFLQSANVGTLFLNVPERDMEYVHEAKGNKASGTACMYDVNGQVLYKGDLREIAGRGNYTWSLDKKPYNITLGSDADLLGTGAADNWILLANAADSSHLRNKVAYTFASELGLAYSPACDWVDLYINGTYVGLYLLSERNEIHPQRIAIENKNSFLVSTELEKRLTDPNISYFPSRSGNVFRIRHNTLPDGEMTQVLQCVENAILAEDGVDPLTKKHYTELIDMDSWVRKYLVEEILGNYDGGSLSQYFYFQKSDGKVYAGPIWDMDNSMGISEWAASANAVLAGRSHFWSQEDQPLFHALMQKSAFYETVLKLYQKDMLPLLERYCAQEIPAYAKRIAQAVQLDQLYWQWEPSETGAEYIINYLQTRTDFWNKRWFSTESYYTVEGYFPGWIMVSLDVKEGEPLSSIPYYGPFWYLSDAEEPYDLTLPVYQDLFLTYEPNLETE